MLKKEKPVITYILLAVNIFYFLFLEAIGNSQSTDFMCVMEQLTRPIFWKRESIGGW